MSDTGSPVTLVTGEPGSGKSALVVSELLKMSAVWDKKPDDRRPIYAFGVSGLKIDHHELPVYPMRGSLGDEWARDDLGFPEEPLAVAWDQLPDGSHVVIDEAHYLFPPRPQGSKVPLHVSWFSTVRHRGITVVIMTQKPVDIDVAVRGRVGVHRHLVQLWFGWRSLREWGGVSTTLKAPRTARLWRVPSSAFGSYKSATVHTKGNATSMPVWIVVPVAAVALGVWAVPSAWRAISGSMSGKGVASVSPSSAPSNGGQFVRPVQSSGSSPEPVQSAVAVQAPASSVAACISMGSRCQCIDTDGYRVALPAAECRDSSREYGRLIPYPVRPPVGERPHGVEGEPRQVADATGAVQRAMHDLGAPPGGVGARVVQSVGGR